MMPAQEDTQRCIDACTECAGICTETVMYCLEQGSEHAEPSHVRIMLDCADICRTATDFMLRDSHFAGQVCAMCAEVCDQCAEECAHFTDDAQMQRCAEACRIAAQACREMSGGMRQAA